MSDFWGDEVQPVCPICSNCAHKHTSNEIIESIGNIIDIENPKTQIKKFVITAKKSFLNWHTKADTV